MDKLFQRIKRNKKGILAQSADALSGFAIGIFVFIIVVFTVLKGVSAVQATETATSSIYTNLTAMLNAVGQFSQYADLIVIIGILAVVILLVSSAFSSSRR